MKPEEIIEGKFYRTRCGYKLEVYRTDRLGKLPVHAGVFFDERWNIVSLTIEGKFRTESEIIHNCDIMSIWTDPPVVDWIILPKWTKAIAMDGDGDWYGFTIIPEKMSLTEIWNDPNDDYIFNIPPEYAPKYDGSWEESLVIRPE